MAHLPRLGAAAILPVIEDQTHHQLRQRRAGLWRERLPCGRLSCAVAAGQPEQIELLAGASMLMMTLVLPLHGPLPDSGRESPRLRPEPGHSMIRRADCQSLSSTRRAPSAATPTNGRAQTCIGAQTERSNIQAGSSSHRPEASSSQLQRKTSPAVFSITSWMCTSRPNHGCHAYRTSRSSVLWAFRRRVVQSPPPAFEP